MVENVVRVQVSQGALAERRARMSGTAARSREASSGVREAVAVADALNAMGAVRAVPVEAFARETDARG